MKIVVDKSVLEQAQVATLTAQRDALLTALRRIAMASEATVCNQEWIAKTARAAIKAVEEIGHME